MKKKKCNRAKEKKHSKLIPLRDPRDVVNEHRFRHAASLTLSGWLVQCCSFVVCLIFVNFALYIAPLIILFAIRRRRRLARTLSLVCTFVRRRRRWSWYGNELFWHKQLWNVNFSFFLAFNFEAQEQQLISSECRKQREVPKRKEKKKRSWTHSAKPSSSIAMNGFGIPKNIQNPQAHTAQNEKCEQMRILVLLAVHNTAFI